MTLISIPPSLSAQPPLLEDEEELLEEGSPEELEELLDELEDELPDDELEEEAPEELTTQVGLVACMHAEESQHRFHSQSGNGSPGFGQVPINPLLQCKQLPEDDELEEEAPDEELLLELVVELPDDELLDELDELLEDEDDELDDELPDELDELLEDETVQGMNSII